MKRKKGFTLAEILITLAVIGIVAAIAIPSMIVNISEKTFDTRRKALYARFSQSVPLMKKIANYGTLSKDRQNNITDTASESFINEGLSKVMKINTVCRNNDFSRCNFPETFTAMDGTTLINLSDIKSLIAYNSAFASPNYGQLDTKASVFETINGESMIVYYNPNCTGNHKETTTHYSLPKMCANFVYDLNGTKPPNMVGKDIGFITILYSTESVIVAPMPLNTNAGTGNYTEAVPKCKAQNPESRLPNIDEVASIFYNKKLLNLTGNDLWSSSAISPGVTGKAWELSLVNGYRYPSTKTNRYVIRCIKR